MVLYPLERRFSPAKESVNISACHTQGNWLWSPLRQVMSAPLKLLSIPWTAMTQNELKKKAAGSTRSKSRVLTLQIFPNCQNSLLLVYHPTVRTAVEKMNTSTDVLPFSVQQLLLCCPGPAQTPKVTQGRSIRCSKNLQTCFNFM